MEEIEREDKSLLFTMIFSEKESALKLYNALTRRNYTDLERLVISRIGNAICLSMKNDVGLVIEARDTLRGMKDLFPMLLNIQSENEKGKAVISFPVSSLLVMYYGQDDVPGYEEKLVFNSVFAGKDSVDVGVRMHVLNINKGYNDNIKSLCKLLDDYSEYIYRIRVYQKNMSIQEAVERAINECMQENILSDFLYKHRDSVISMSIAEFDQTKICNKEKQECYNEGREKGRVEGAHDMLRELVGKRLMQGNSLEEIADMFELGIPQICSLIEEIYEVEESRH